MVNGLGSSLHNIARLSTAKSRSISAENFKGEKGGGGRAVPEEGTGSARDLGVGWKVSPCIHIEPGETAELADIEGPGVIKHIWIVESLQRDRTLILRTYWDGNDKPSIETPLGDFFGSSDSSHCVPYSSLAVCVNPKGAFNCYWEMPFHNACKITLENIHTEPITVYYQIDYTEEAVAENSAYFHAQFRRVNPLPYKEVYTILDNVKGRGHYVGTYLFWGVNNSGWWGEGEIKFYLDGDKEFPTICGTGTEDYFCGSYNFDIGGKYQEFCTPYAGLAKVLRPDGLYYSQTRFSMYRWHLLDPIYFEQDIKVTIQALGWRSGGRYLPLQDDISSVAFWYQKDICKTFPEFPDRNALEIV